MKHKAFTFWEVTVVLVLLAIAGVVLFPVFFRARESGRSPHSTCQSNLRQIGLGLAQYIQDANEKYPPLASDWPAISQPYLKSWQIFQCSLDRNSSAQPTQLTTDYFFNARLLGNDAGKVVNPNLTIMAGDGLGDQNAATLGRLPPAWKDDANSPAFRHRNGANYAFADGHVKWLAPDKITLNSPLKMQPTFTVK